MSIVNRVLSDYAFKVEREADATNSSVEKARLRKRAKGVRALAEEHTDFVERRRAEQEQAVAQLEANPLLSPAGRRRVREGVGGDWQGGA